MLLILILLESSFPLVLSTLPDNFCGAAGAGSQPRPGFRFPLKWWGSPPPLGHLEPAHQQVPKMEQRESGKARERLSLNKSPRKFVPIELLCKHVTNPLKPATNCLCSPYKFMQQLGLGAFSDPAPLHWLQREPWLESVINFPFFCELHCLGSLLSSRSGIWTSGITSLDGVSRDYSLVAVHRLAVASLVKHGL